MDDQYFIRIKGKILGPFSLAELRDLRARGKFTSHHEFSKDGRSWLEAGVLSDVFPCEASVAVADLEAPADHPTESAVTDDRLFYFLDATGAMRGPISGGEFKTLLHFGQVHASTLVWCDGMSQWQPFRSAAKSLGLPSPRAIPQEPPDSGTEPPRGHAAHSGSDPERDIYNRLPIPVAMLLHFITFGVSTFVILNVLHGRFPRKRSDDPSAGKAIGFFFIPLFNLYWIFFAYYRLCIRINEQRRARQLRSGISPVVSILRSCVKLAWTACLALFMIMIPLVLFGAFREDTIGPGSLMTIGVLFWALDFVIVSPMFAAIVLNNVSDLVFE